MATLYTRNNAENEYTEVNDQNPLPVEVMGGMMPPVGGQTVTRRAQIPGIGAAAAYSALDQFGTLITFPDVFRAEKRSGTIVNVLYYDFDDEGIGKTLLLFSRPVTAGTDNAAVALADGNALACRGSIIIGTFGDAGNWQIGQANNQALWVSGESVHLYGILTTAGADNIAAGAMPQIALVVLPD